MTEHPSAGYITDGIDVAMVGCLQVLIYFDETSITFNVGIFKCQVSRVRDTSDGDQYFLKGVGLLFFTPSNRSKSKSSASMAWWIR